MLMLGLLAFAPGVDARLIPCHDPSINFKPACAYMDPSSGEYLGDCYGYFLHDPVTNQETWVYCDWE